MSQSCIRILLNSHLRLHETTWRNTTKYWGLWFGLDIRHGSKDWRSWNNAIVCSSWREMTGHFDDEIRYPIRRNEFCSGRSRCSKKCNRRDDEIVVNETVRLMQIIEIGDSWNSKQTANSSPTSQVTGFGRSINGSTTGAEEITWAQVGTTVSTFHRRTSVNFQFIQMPIYQWFRLVQLYMFE